MGRRKKSEPEGHQSNLGAWKKIWHPPRAPKVKDILPHLRVEERGAIFVRDQVVLGQTITKHWPFFRDLIDKEDLPKVYRCYKKGI